LKEVRFMKTSLKRFTALALMFVVMLAGILPVSAAENLFVAGRNYVIVGKGAEGQSIVMDLNGKSEVKATYYPVTSVKMSKPDYMVDVEDIPKVKDKDLEIKVIYNSNLEMYGIQITARELLDSSFTIKYLKRTGPNYQAVALNTVNLMVIDGDDHLPNPDIDGDDEDDDENDELYRAYRSQASSTNVQEGLKACADGQALVVDISSNDRIANAWLKTLKEYPSKSLIFAGDSYSWTVKGSDIKSIKSYLSHYVGVSRVADNQAEIEAACGINNVPVIVINGMSKFPAAESQLRIQLMGQSFKGTTVNVYRYENGKVITVAEDLETDGDGFVSFPVTKPGTYFASRFKSSKAV